MKKIVLAAMAILVLSVALCCAVSKSSIEKAYIAELNYKAAKRSGFVNKMEKYENEFIVIYSQMTEEERTEYRLYRDQQEIAATRLGLAEKEAINILNEQL